MLLIPIYTKIDEEKIWTLTPRYLKLAGVCWRIGTSVFSTPMADADGGNCGYIMDFLPPPERTNDKSELGGDERAPILPPHLLSSLRQLQNSSVVKITRAGSLRFVKWRKQRSCCPQTNQLRCGVATPKSGWSPSPKCSWWACPIGK